MTKKALAAKPAWRRVRRAGSATNRIYTMLSVASYGKFSVNSISTSANTATVKRFDSTSVKPSSSQAASVKDVFSVRAAQGGSDVYLNVKTASVRSDANKTTTYVYINDWAVSNVVYNVLKERGLHTTTHWWTFDVNEDKTISLPRDRCFIDGLDEDELNDVLTEIESRLDMDKMFVFFESSKPVLPGNGARKWDDVSGQKSVNGSGIFTSTQKFLQYSAILIKSIGIESFQSRMQHLGQCESSPESNTRPVSGGRRFSE